MKTESILFLISSPESKYKRNPSLKIDYKIDTDIKYEVNNLINIKKISKPDFEKIKRNLQTLDKNVDELYANILHKMVNEKYIFIRKIDGDGNCYFRSLSFFMTNSQNYYSYFRNYIYNYIYLDLKGYIIEYPYVYHNNNIKPIEEYVTMMNID